MSRYCHIFVFFICSVAVGDKTPTKEQNEAAAGQAPVKGPTCNFTISKGILSAIYDPKKYLCRKCTTTVSTLSVLNEHAKKLDVKGLCNINCNGLFCMQGNVSCLPAEEFGKYTPSCNSLSTRIAANNPKNWLGDREEQRITTNSQIPLIVGFTIGGILLAIVVAGIFLGRNQRTDDMENSENMTTPVSLSNSEWQSNGNGPGNPRQAVSNMRVEEASREDLTVIPTDNPPNGDIMNGFHPNGNGYRLKSTSDDGSFLGQNSYYDSDLCVTYYPRDGHSPVHSYRSEDTVMLDDGYRPGGNFVGSADPEVRGLLVQKSHDGHDNMARESDQDMFSLQDVWGETNPEIPCSMTHESITLSLTHSPHCGGMEYVIEDQDLVAFEEPVSFKKQERTPTNNMQPLEETDEGVMRICVQYRDADSDFEDTASLQSRQNLVFNGDKSGLYDDKEKPPEVGGVNNECYVRSASGLHIESPCSESGIEVSCNSKDSCEIRLKTANQSGNMAISCHARSWNENCKGSAGPQDHESQRINKTPTNSRFFPRSENRSKSCNWKSPAAPTHSSSRKYSAPTHCPLSTPPFARAHVTNLTHVFVDVHRSMVSSDEDMLGYQSTDRRRRPASISSSDCSSMSDLSSAARLPTPEPGPFSTSSMPRNYQSPPTQLTNQKRNKSMYLPRDSALKRSSDRKPRTVRFSSSGSGEYAIPFGSLVP